MSFARYFLATALTVSNALPSQADSLPADLDTQVLDFTLADCRDDATPLATIVGAFALPQIREQIVTDANCVSTLQYRLAQGGHYVPFTADERENDQTDIAAVVDGKFGISTLRAMTRYILSLGLNDPRPEIMAQIETNNDPLSEQIVQELVGVLPKDELNAYTARIAELYRNRAIELSHEKNAALTSAFRYCVLHEAQASTNIPENYESMLKNWQGTFGSFVSVACMPIIQDLPMEEQEAIIDAARQALEDFIPEWKYKLNPPTQSLPDDSLKQQPVLPDDSCGVTFGPIPDPRCRKYDI